MKLQMMLMRMARRRSRVDPVNSEFEAIYTEQTVADIDSTVAPECNGSHRYKNPKMTIRSCDSLLLGSCSSSSDDMYFPSGDGLSPPGGDNHSPVIATCNSPFVSSSLCGRPLRDHITSTFSDLRFHIDGNLIINREGRTDILLTENDIQINHNKESFTPNPGHAVFERTRCQWGECEMIIESDLIRHLHIAHLNGPNDDSNICRWRSCQKRGKLLNDRPKLLSHVRIHTNRVFTCAVCSKGFSRKEALKIHTRYHTGETPYLCSFLGCNKTFKSPSDRSKHVKTHQDSHPYRCKVSGCGKKYTDPSTRRKHEKTHLMNNVGKKISKSSQK